MKKTLRYRGVPVIGFAAYSGGGKTTLVRKLIPLLKKRGLRPSVVKHAHHDFDIDYPGKDSYEIRKAGAAQVLVGSVHRRALVLENTSGIEPTLSDFLAALDLRETDIVLVEGFRDEAFPKIEVNRKTQGRDLFYPNDENVIALVTDDVASHAAKIDCIALERDDLLADFIVEYRRLAKGP